MKKEKAAQKRSILTIIGIFALISMIAALLIYRVDLEDNLHSANRDTLNNVMEQQRFTFASKLQDQVGAIKIYADFFEYAGVMSERMLLEKLDVIRKNSTFDYVSYATLKGAAVENTGAHLGISDRGYFKRALAGETVIADPVPSKVTGSDIVTISTPILHNQEVAAVLIGVYDVDTLSKLLMTAFGEKGYAYVTTGAGEVIFKTETPGGLPLYGNLFETMDSPQSGKSDGRDDIRSNTKAGLPGYTRFYRDGEFRLMHYMPLGVNDWYLFSIAPESAINPQTISIMSNATIFMMIVVLLSVGALAYIFIVQRNHVKELSKIAYIDALTGMPNKRRFRLIASELLAASEQRYAFVILDIDKCKVLNDTLGYACGDALLLSIAHILKDSMRYKETFGRCDSDEFYMLLAYTDDHTLLLRARNIIAKIETDFRNQVTSGYNLVLCAGIYVITNPKESINSISDRARHAHRLIKGKDESGVCFFNEDIRSHILEEKEIENKMRDGLVNEEFLLYLQPKYYLEDEKIYGAEALVRWSNGYSTMVYPNKFIPIFEKNGFVTKLDMYMLDKTCQTIRGWIDTGITPVPISINFSRLHLRNPLFVDDIAKIVDKYQIPPELIEVELTESTMLHNEDVLIAMLEHLHLHGFTLSMDDFGSGYSSLGLLKNLPVDVIKLDRTFFVDCCEVKRAVTVVAGIIDMAKNLGIKTVAEGVETKEQIIFLKELGCDIVQGYYYAKPMPSIELNTFLERDAAYAGETGE